MRRRYKRRQRIASIAKEIRRLHNIINAGGRFFLLAILPPLEHKTLRRIVKQRERPPHRDMPPVEMNRRPLRIMLHGGRRTAIVDIFVGHGLPGHAGALGQARHSVM